MPLHIPPVPSAFGSAFIHLSHYPSHTPRTPPRLHRLPSSRLPLAAPFIYASFVQRVADCFLVTRYLTRGCGGRRTTGYALFTHTVLVHERSGSVMRRYTAAHEHRTHTDNVLVPYGQH